MRDARTHTYTDTRTYHTDTNADLQKRTPNNERNVYCVSQSFDVSTSYSSFRWGAAGEKCDVTV
jgi:hypothetical protein